MPLKFGRPTHGSLAHQISRNLVVTILRMYYLIWRVHIDSETERFEYSVKAVMLSVVESNVAIICGRYLNLINRSSKLTAFAFLAILPTLEYGAFANWFSSYVKGKTHGGRLYQRRYLREQPAEGYELADRFHNF